MNAHSVKTALITSDPIDYESPLLQIDSSLAQSSVTHLVQYVCLPSRAQLGSKHCASAPGGHWKPPKTPPAGQSSGLHGVLPIENCQTSM